MSPADADECLICDQEVLLLLGVVGDACLVQVSFESAVAPKDTLTFHSTRRQAADNLPLEKQYQYEQRYDGRDYGCNCIHDLVF